MLSPSGTYLFVFLFPASPPPFFLPSLRLCSTPFILLDVFMWCFRYPLNTYFSNICFSHFPFSIPCPWLLIWWYVARPPLDCVILEARLMSYLLVVLSNGAQNGKSLLADWKQFRDFWLPAEWRFILSNIVCLFWARVALYSSDWTGSQDPPKCWDYRGVPSCQAHKLISHDYNPCSTLVPGVFNGWTNCLAFSGFSQSFNWNILSISLVNSISLKTFLSQRN